ncbi:MAG TPA: MazG nucleotide pyrophosphohydrolase domain-containing protein [Patescibacteria group bacterium]|nr:MazG nucleotide pyrophosphohydrolase domain-containing protein [Patescibacteria group bacterium]
MSKLHLKDNPTLKDIQQYVAEMEIERGFTSVTVLETCLLLIEEMGELAKCVRKSSHTSMRVDSAKQYQENAAEEIADIILVLTSIANRLDVDLETALREKEEVNKLRVWE